MNDFRVRRTDDRFNHWTVANGDTYSTSTEYINEDGAKTRHCEAFDTEAEAQAVLDLYLGKNKIEDEISSEMVKYTKITTQEQFNTLIQAVYDHCIVGVMCKKSVEYARGGDKLYNFKRASEMSGYSPIECLRGMKLKHDVSVDDMLNDEDIGIVHPQALWTEKLSDQINYTLLLWALLHEKYDWEIPNESN